MELEKEVCGTASSVATDVDSPADTEPHDADVEKQHGHPGEAADATSDGGEERQSNPNIVNWDGPDDPENPMNWPLSKKAGAICIISLITFLS
jgi:hypothetical protein